MRTYGVKSGKNNINRFVARSYMYNSNQTNNSNQRNYVQQELKDSSNYDYDKKKRTEKRLIVFAIIYHISEMILYELFCR